MKNTAIIFIITICAALMNTSSFASAQTNEGADLPAGLQISPARFDWTLHSGTQQVGTVNVKNYSDQERSVTAHVENFFVSPDSEHTNLFGGDANHMRHAFNVIDWFVLPDDFILAPGESKNVEFLVRVPDDQPTNGYYGSLLFQTTNTRSDQMNDSQGASLNVNYRVGAIVTLAVRGEEDPMIGGVLESFESSRVVYVDDPVKFSAYVLNDGNMHYKASGKIIVTRFGTYITTIEIVPEVLYPEARRTFVEKMPFNTWDFGVYKAQIQLQSEEDGVIVLDGATDTFYVAPRKGLIFIGIGLLCIIVIFILFRYVFDISLKKNKK